VTRLGPTSAVAYREDVRTLNRHHVARLFPAALLALLALAPAAASAAGPPFPDPVEDQAVYDTAGVLRPATISTVESQIDAIENRTGAEVVVYTQLTRDNITTGEAEQDAMALMDQWGVGRAGIDDGLVILFDLKEDDPCHGQVQLYAGPGYRATYLSNDERQSLYEDEMLPALRRCDLDGALLVAMQKIDANASQDHANTLTFFRQANAVLGLIVAPALFVLLVAWGTLTWFRSGRDPVYLDDPSIHIPAPPVGLTPAAGAAIRDGKVSRRALTAASLDLAVRGLLAFEAQQKGLLAKHTELSMRTGEAVPGDPQEQFRMDRARSRPMDDATQFLLGRLTSIGGSSGLIEPDEMLRLGKDVSGFQSRLETYTVRQGWFAERPGSATGRWVARGILFAILGGVAFFVGVNVPSSGILLVGVGLVAGGIFLAILSAVMPAVTPAGAMIRAMLEAYRRTLQKTMAQARSMGEVVQASAIPLIESPDDAVAWGVALGLQGEVEAVLQRTADDLGSGVSHAGYLPLWYGAGGGFGGGGGGGGGWAPGLMSSSPIPDFGGMMSALGTIGNSPASSGSGSGGGGGFGGGGSGGGGGGAGGGF
jgi:uncharacterized membrane protein YgcG